MQANDGAEWFLEFLPVAAIWTHDGLVVDCNDAAVRLLGVPRSAPTLEAWASALGGPPEATVLVNHLREAMAGRNVPRTHVQLHKTANEVTGLYVQSYPAPFPDGRLGAVAIFEADLRIDDDQRRMDTWLGALAHELSGTVQSMAINMELLRRDCAGNDAAKRRLDCVERNSKILRRLVTDYIDAARADEGDLKCRPSVLKLHPLLERVREAHHLVDVNHHIELSGEFELIAHVDETWLNQILRNLLSNAQKYSAPGIVEIATERSGDHILVKLIDEGPGIPLALQNRLFARFARLPSAAEGSGLGLWLSRHLARRMGGDLWLESEGSRSTFVLALPTGGRHVCDSGVDEEEADDDEVTPARTGDLLTADALTAHSGDGAPAFR